MKVTRCRITIKYFSIKSVATAQRRGPVDDAAWRVGGIGAAGVPSQCPTRLGQGCWMRAWLWHLLTAAKLYGGAAGRLHPRVIRRRWCVEPEPVALGSRRQRV